MLDSEPGPRTANSRFPKFERNGENAASTRIRQACETICETQEIDDRPSPNIENTRSYFLFFYYPTQGVNVNLYPLSICLSDLFLPLRTVRSVHCCIGSITLIAIRVRESLEWKWNKWGSTGAHNQWFFLELNMFDHLLSDFLKGAVGSGVRILPRSCCGISKRFEIPRTQTHPILFPLSVCGYVYLHVSTPSFT